MIRIFEFATAFLAVLSISAGLAAAEKETGKTKVESDTGISVQAYGISTDVTAGAEAEAASGKDDADEKPSQDGDG